MAELTLADTGYPLQIKIGQDAIIAVDASGNVTLDGAASGALKVRGGVAPPVETIPGDGAITIPAGGFGVVLLTKGAAAAITLADPTSPAQDGTIIMVKSLTAFAHVITAAGDGFNAKGAAGTATANGAFTGLLILYADSGHWYTLGENLWTIA